MGDPGVVPQERENAPERRQRIRGGVGDEVAVLRHQLARAAGGVETSQREEASQERVLIGAAETDRRELFRELLKRGRTGSRRAEERGVDLFPVETDPCAVAPEEDLAERVFVVRSDDVERHHVLTNTFACFDGPLESTPRCRGPTR